MLAWEEWGLWFRSIWMKGRASIWQVTGVHVLWSQLFKLDVVSRNGEHLSDEVQDKQTDK